MSDAISDCVKGPADALCAPRKSAADAADAAAACCHFAALISGPVTIGCIAGCAWRAPIAGETMKYSRVCGSVPA